MDEFKSITKFKVFNTNNLWASLSAIDRLVTEGKMVNDVIVNKKVGEFVNVCIGRGWGWGWGRKRERCLYVS